MITFSQLAMHYGAKMLFDDVNLHIDQGKRYGLVGANGSGKSTFLRLITKEDEPTLGSINIPKNTCIGWLKQDQYLFENEPILEVVLRGKVKLWETLKKK